MVWLEISRGIFDTRYFWQTACMFLWPFAISFCFGFSTISRPLRFMPQIYPRLYPPDVPDPSPTLSTQFVRRTPNLFLIFGSKRFTPDFLDPPELFLASCLSNFLFV